MLKFAVRNEILKMISQLAILYIVEVPSASIINVFSVVKVLRCFTGIGCDYLGI